MTQTRKLSLEDTQTRKLSLEDMARVCSVVAIVLSFDVIFGAGSSPVFIHQKATI